MSLGVSSARCVATGTGLTYSCPPLPVVPSPVHVQATLAEGRAAREFSQGFADTWEPQQLAANSNHASGRMPRLASPLCSSLGSASWAGAALTVAPRRKVEPRPEPRPTIDVATAMRPRASTAELLAKHGEAMSTTMRLRQERTDLLETLEALHARQLQLRPRKVHAYESLRLQGSRTARPSFGTYDYLGPVGRGVQLSRGAM